MPTTGYNNCCNPWLAFNQLGRYNNNIVTTKLKTKMTETKKQLCPFKKINPKENKAKYKRVFDKHCLFVIIVYVALD